MTALYFDTIAYLQEARDAGVTQKAAEVQAKYMQLAMNEVTQTTHEHLAQRDWATKQDLQIVRQDLQQDLQLVKQDVQLVKQDLQIMEQKLESKLDFKIEQVRKEIEQSKNSLMIWLFSLLTTYSGVMTGIICRGFHWW